MALMKMWMPLRPTLLTACLLLACWLLGANPTATFVAAAIAAIVASA